MAEIRWIYAPIGGGKSYFSVRELTKELRRTERHCVFSLPVLLDEKFRPDKRYETLQEWCDRSIKKPVNISRRVFFLTAEQQREFWLYIPADGVSVEQLEMWNERQRQRYEKYKFPEAFNRWLSQQEDEKREVWHQFEFVRNDIDGLGTSYGIKLPWRPHPLYGVLGDFTFRTSPELPQYCNRGCLYQLDEVHKSFPARYWQALGPQVEDYVSEVRKLNDDVDLITQHPEKVDKNMRRNATEWVHVVNMDRTRLFMGVTFKKRFRYYCYQQTEMPGKSDKPTTQEFFSRGGKDRIEFIYLTMWGQSVRGAGTSESNKRTGLHPIVWVFFIVGIFIAAHYFPLIIEEAVAKAVGAGAQGLSKGFQRGVSSALPQPQVSVVTHSNLPPDTNTVSQAPAVLPPPAQYPASRFVPVAQVMANRGLFCVGIVHMPDDPADIRVMLSDGRMAYSKRGEVQDIGLRFVRVFGEAAIPIK